GAGTAPVTVKTTPPGLLAAPPGVVTVKALAPGTAAPDTVTDMFTVAGAEELTMAVTAGSANVTAVAPARFVPLITAATAAPPGEAEVTPVSEITDGADGDAPTRLARSLASWRAA